MTLTEQKKKDSKFAVQVLEKLHCFGDLLVSMAFNVDSFENKIWYFKWIDSIDSEKKLAHSLRTWNWKNALLIVVMDKMTKDAY